MANPYYMPGEDDDIFEEPEEGDAGTSAQRHVLDGSLCHCGKTHNLHLPMGAPPEVIDKLSEYIDHLPDQAMSIIVTAENTLSMKLMHDFMTFATEVDTVNKQGPFMRAIAELLDELAGGNKIGPLVKFYEAEQMVISTHVVTKALEGLRDKLVEDTKNEDREKQHSIFDALNRILEAASVRMDLAIERYTITAEETNNVVDKNIIETGVYGEEASYFASRLVQIPLINMSTVKVDSKINKKKNDVAEPKSEEE